MSSVVFFSQFVTIQNAVPVQQPVSGNATSPSFSAPGKFQLVSY